MIFLVQAQHRIFQAFLTAARSTMRGWRLRLLLQGTFLTFANLAYAQFQNPCFATPSDEEFCCDDTETERSDCFDFIYTAVECCTEAVAVVNPYELLHASPPVLQFPSIPSVQGWEGGSHPSFHKEQLAWEEAMRLASKIAEPQWPAGLGLENLQLMEYKSMNMTDEDSMKHVYRRGPSSGPYGSILRC